MTLETMQREGREVSIDYYDTADGAGVRTEWRTIATVDLDQHTANVWKAAQEASQKRIEELEEEVEDLVMEIKVTGEYD